MITEILAKSRPPKDFSGVIGIASELFDGAVRDLHYPLTPSFSFDGLQDLVSEFALIRDQFGMDKVTKLTIHGHGKRVFFEQADGSSKAVIALQMGADNIQSVNVDTAVPQLEKIGKYMDPDGEVALRHCFAGSADAIMPKIAKAFGCKVSGEIMLDNLSPALTSIQNAGLRLQRRNPAVGLGRRIFFPDGSSKME